MATAPAVCEFGWKATDFELLATDGRRYRLADLRGAAGLLIAFICNHCPYVKASIDRLVGDAAALRELGIGVAAIMPKGPRPAGAEHGLLD
jgi:peroxiredoxin